MKRLAEAILFTSLAAGLHLAVFWARPADDGPSAGGVGGAADITLAGAAPETVALVAEWERTPEIAAPPVASQQPSPPETAPVETPRAGLATPRPKEPPQIAPAPGALTAPSLEALAEPVPDTPVELAELLRPEMTEAPPPKPVSERIARLEPAAAPEPPRARAAPPRAPENATPPPEPEETSAPEASPPPQSRPERAPTPPKTVAKPKPAPAPPPPETNPAPAANEMANDGAGDSAPASLAAGDGGGAEAGSGGADQALGSGASAALAQLWGGAIRREVEARKRFPRNVRRTGVTMVALRVARTGALVSSHVRESSGSKALDEAAIRAVRDAAPYAAAPDGLSGASFEFALPVVFRR